MAHLKEDGLFIVGSEMRIGEWIVVVAIANWYPIVTIGARTMRGKREKVSNEVYWRPNHDKTDNIIVE